MKRGFKIVRDKFRKHKDVEIQLPKRRSKCSAGYDIYTPDDIVIPPYGISDAIQTDIKAFMLNDEVLKEEFYMNDKVYFAGEKGVKIPTKIDENAGYDIYAFFEEDYILIQPHETVMIPTGLYSAFSKDYVAILKERGSTGTKGMCQKSGVIDSGYRGAWMVPITNLNTKPLYISKLTKEELIEKFKNKYMNKLTEDDKTEYIIDISIEVKRLTSLLDNAIIYPYSKAIAQAIFVPVPKLETETISIEELKAIPSVRGEGKLGSSNK